MEAKGSAAVSKSGSEVNAAAAKCSITYSGTCVESTRYPEPEAVQCRYTTRSGPVFSSNVSRQASASSAEPLKIVQGNYQAC